MTRYWRENIYDWEQANSRGLAAVLPAGLAEFYQSALSGREAMTSLFLQREQAVSHIFVQGEALQWVRQETSAIAALPSSPPWLALLAAAPRSTIENANLRTMIDLGSSEGPVDMHSMRLLALALNSDKLKEVIRTTPWVLPKLLESGRSLSTADATVTSAQFMTRLRSSFWNSAA
jgi:hypothetical protein